MLEKIQFKINTPYISLEDKLLFLQEFIHPEFKLTYANKRLGIDIKLNGDTFEEKLLNRIGVYLKTNSLTLGGLNYQTFGLTYSEAKEKLVELLSLINQQFNLYIKNNYSITDALIEKIKQGAIKFEELFNPPVEKSVNFEPSIQDKSGIIYNVNKNWNIADYQLSFINKILKGMVGINAFDVGLGKAQPLSANVLTPFGWKKMGELKVGDLIYAYNGEVCKITAIYPQGKKKTFTVKTNDGSFTRCCEEHLWFTQTITEKDNSHNKSILNGVSTLLSGSVKALKDIDPVEQHALPTVCPIPFSEKELPLQPYFLGALLGQFNHFLINEHLYLPSWQIDNLRFLLDKRNEESAVDYLPRFWQNSYSDVYVEKEEVEKYQSILDSLNLLNIETEKRFIPNAYKQGSIKQRLAFLQGFLDCTGFFNESNRSIFTRTYSEQLTKDIKDIVNSLGGTCSIRDKEQFYSLKITLSNKIYCDGKVVLPFKNPIQVQKMLSVNKIRALRTILDITPYGEEECQCIAIDHPSHLYITDDYIVTHNTSTSLISVQNLHNKSIKQKTLFVVPNAALSNFEKEAYLGTKKNPPVLVDRSDSLFIYPAKGADLTREWRKALNPAIKKVFCTYETFFALKVKKESLDAYIKYQSTHDESFLLAMETSSKKAENFCAKLERFTQSGSQKLKAELHFEDFNFDSIVIDELHAYKNSKEVWGSLQAKYLPLSPVSARGLDAQIKCWLIRQYNLLYSGKEDGVLGLTATPLTNSPFEFYSILTLIVGEEQLNNLLGLNSSFDFLLSTCEIESDDDYSVDGEARSFNVFKGIKNLSLLRPALFKIITFLTHENVRSGHFIPKEQKHTFEVELSKEQREKVLWYKRVYSICKKLIYGEEEQQIAILRSKEWKDIESFLNERHEEPEVAASPFNFIAKMERLILEEDVDLQGIRFIIPALSAESTLSDNEKAELRSKVEGFVHKFNAKKLKERRVRPNQRTQEFKEHFNESGDLDGYECVVSIYLNNESEWFLDSQLYQTQLLVYQALNDLTPVAFYSSPKIEALLENINEQINNPRGKINGEIVPFVKQLLFCDQLSSHLKLQVLIHQRCGLKFENIHILTGQTNSDPMEVIDLQTKFNFQTTEHSIIIANEKAEVNLNLQVGTQAIHHLTIGWTPDSIHQRNGRAARYGNETDYVAEFFYDAINTFDGYKRRLVNHKENWISKMIDQNGEDFVSIEHNLSKKQYEQLIEQLGEEDLSEYQKSWEKEQEKKKLEKALSDQKIFLRTILSSQRQQEQTLEDFALNFINNALEQVAKLRLEALRFKDKPEDLLRIEQLIVKFQEKMANYFTIDESQIKRRVLKNNVVQETLVHLGKTIILNPLKELKALRQTMAERLKNDCREKFLHLSKLKGSLPSELIEKADKGELYQFGTEFVFKGCRIIVGKGFYDYSPKYMHKISDYLYNKSRSEILKPEEKVILDRKVDSHFKFDLADLPLLLNAVKVYSEKLNDIRKNATEKDVRYDLCENFGNLLKGIDFSLFYCNEVGEALTAETAVISMGKELDNITPPTFHFKPSVEEVIDQITKQNQMIEAKVLYPAQNNALFAELENFLSLKELYNAYLFTYSKGMVSRTRMDALVSKALLNSIEIDRIKRFNLMFSKQLLERYMQLKR